jgi:hypothetical protein
MTPKVAVEAVLWVVWVRERVRGLWRARRSRREEVADENVADFEKHSAALILGDWKWVPCRKGSARGMP